MLGNFYLLLLFFLKIVLYLFIYLFICSWGGQSNLVFEALYSDFMRPRINEVS